MVALVAEKLAVTASNLPGVFWRFRSVLYSAAPYAWQFFSRIETVTWSAYFWVTRRAYKAKTSWS